MIDGVPLGLALHRQDPQGAGLERLLQSMAGPDQPGKSIEDAIAGHRNIRCLRLGVLDAAVNARGGDHDALVRPRRGVHCRSISDGDLRGGGQSPHLPVPPALRSFGMDLGLAVGQLKEPRLFGIHEDRPYARQPPGPTSGEHGRAGVIGCRMAAKGCVWARRSVEVVRSLVALAAGTD